MGGQRLGNGTCTIEGGTVTRTHNNYVTATETGKSESERVKITALPKYEKANGTDLTIDSPTELRDYLNYCEPGAAALSGNTVTQNKDVVFFHDLTLGAAFDGTWNLGGKTATHNSGTTGTALTLDQATTKLTLTGGTLTTQSPVGLAAGAGEVTMTGLTLNAVSVAIMCANAKLTMTNVTATCADESGETLYIISGQVAIHTGSFTNSTGGMTYLGAVPLSTLIPSTSTSTPAESTEVTDGGTTGQVCTGPITVTLKAPPAYT